MFPPTVLFSDNHLLVVDKPAGMPTQPSQPGEMSLEDWAKNWVKKQFSKTGNVFLVPVHRLDKPVGGLVLFARTSKALSRLNEMMRNREIKKTYHARIEGKPPADSGSLEHALVHDEFHARVVGKDHPGAKLALLHYKLLEEGLVEVNLVTGRYHQIRVQLAAIGCPIRGDSKYGAKTHSNQLAIPLSHVKLEFIHPVTKQPLNFQQPKQRQKI